MYCMASGKINQFMLHAMQCIGMMRERLNGRAAKTVIGLGRQLAKSSDKDDITFLQLQLALRQFHISITPEV